MRTLCRIFILLFCCPALTWAQPSTSEPAAEPDWRSALILRFDPAAYDAETAGSDEYLSSVTDAVLSGRVASAGASAIAIGPLGVVANPSPSGSDDAAVNPSFGSAAAWTGLVSAAGDAALAVMLVLASSPTPAAPTSLASLAEWSRVHRVRHFILEGDAEESRGVAAALRTAFETSAEDRERIWIAAPFDDEPVDAVVAPLVPDPPALSASFADRLASWADRVTSSSRPVITALPRSSASQPPDALLLLLPGSLLVAASPSEQSSSELWNRILAFRKRHPAIGIGEHEVLANSTYSFARTLTRRKVVDAVIVALGASGKTTLNVSRIFPDNTLLRDAVTGSTAFVSFGMATFETDPSGVILIEEAY